MMTIFSAINTRCLRWDWLSGGDALHRRAEGKAVAKFFLEVVQPKMEALDEAAAIK